MTQLFTDLSLVSDIGKACLRQHAPRRENTVLQASEPWEGGCSFCYSNLVYDGERWRLYYRGYPRFGKDDYAAAQVNCLALSDDGIEFRRAGLSAIDYFGCRRNNIVFMGELAHNFSPFIDKNPACRDDERFKAVCGFAKTGLLLYKSADGLEWSPASDRPITKSGEFDSLNTMFYDTLAGKYRVYYRYWHSDSGRAFNGVRAIASVESRDLSEFSEPVRNSYDDGFPLEHFYTNAVTPCPGAEHIYLSFPMRFMPQRTKHPEHGDSGVSDCVFMTSRDGHRWTRFGDAFIRPSTDPDTWTERNYITTCGVADAGSQFFIYVCEHYNHPDCRIVRYSLPRHRFASLYAPREGADVVFKTFTAKSEHLFMNYSTSAAGYVEIGGQKYFGNELSREILFDGKPLGALRGRELSLKVKLCEADLFAVTFR